MRSSSKDRNVSDVLKKLPGINVEENGTIKYNGKVISNLYVRNEICGVGCLGLRH